MDTEEFDATLEEHADRVVVTLSGQFDGGAVERFRDVMAGTRQDGRDVVVDIDRLSFIGVMGIEALAREAFERHRDGRGLVVVSADPRLLKLIVHLGLGDLLPLRRRRRRRPARDQLSARLGRGRSSLTR